MHELLKLISGKRITVVGLGLLGRGIGDVRFLASQGAELIVTDIKTEDELRTSVEALSEFPNITYHLGGHRLEDFRDRDLIIKGPKVPMNSPFIAEAKNNHIPVTMSTALFVKHAGIPTIGVTGTRGKSTVTHMVYDILRRTGRRTLLGGNVVGISTLSLLPEVTPDSVAVLELDSWQLQGFGEERVSPHIAVFTTFFEDHMDYYCGKGCIGEKRHLAMEAYLADKANIFLFQKEDEPLILGPQAAPVVESTYGWRLRKHTIVDPDQFPKDLTLSVPGYHNRENAMCAMEAARAANVPDDVIKSALADFRGIPGRLEFLAERHGVKIYNDTSATAPQATMMALRALSEEGGHKNIILIMGGADKELNMEPLIEMLPASCKKVVLLAGTGTDKIAGTIKEKFPDTNSHLNLESAFAEARNASASGDIILFSPAFASFGMFLNEYERGAQFSRLVRNLSS